MKSLSHHPERHNTHRIGWLRAAVLGANDGVLSTSSLVIEIAASNVTHGAILVSGVGGLVAGSIASCMWRATGNVVVALIPWLLPRHIACYVLRDGALGTAREKGRQHPVC